MESTSHSRRIVLPLILLATILPAQTDWTDITGSSGSTIQRYHHAMTADRARDVIVVFGGRGTTGILGDTREWTAGTGWVQRTTPSSPVASYGCLLAYDRARAQCVLFGGWTGAAYSNQLWAWNGANWSQLATSASPSPRYFPGFVYDPSTASILMFGGHDGSHRNDTWRWDGTNWIQLVGDGQPGSPPARRGPGICWDEHRNVAVMFGGLIQFNPSAIAFNDTWEWNGAWVQRSPATSPPARGHCGMEFDAYRGRSVMHGGDSQGVYNSDTWEWDGNGWTQRTPVTTPTHGTGCGLVYDPLRRRVFRHGGYEPQSAPTDGSWIYQTVLPASFSTYGSGCGPGYVPNIAVAEPHLPWAGSAATVTVTGVPTGRMTLMIVGFDDTHSPLGPLPLTLGGLGAPGCTLLANPQTLEFLGPAPSLWSTGALPAFAAGLSIFVQVGVLDSAANALGVASSAGGRLTIGRR
ncbi:MAG: hypothetical protein KDC98_17695 [Planctomycetes bacterium]|nr:hypothetical protein [Planctomycetota bacterium]